MLSYRNHVVFCALFLLSLGQGWAQTNNPPAPAYTPPPAWNNAPELAPGFVPQQLPTGQVAPGYPPQAPGAEAPYTDNSYFVPVQPAPSFDYFADDEEGVGDAGAGGSRTGRSGAEGKESFKFVEPRKQDTCRKWGHSLIDPATFSDRTKCDFELERKVDRGYSSIDDLYDRVELYKMKKVIRGEVKSRAEANRYSVSFDALRKSLAEASKEGCSCLDH